MCSCVKREKTKYLCQQLSVGYCAKIVYRFTENLDGYGQCY